MFELFYGSGGHGGPYATREDAIANAVRLLRGRPQERRIDVRRYVADAVAGFGPPEVTVRRERGIFRVEYMEGDHAHV